MGKIIQPITAVNYVVKLNINQKKQKLVYCCGPVFIHTKYKNNALFKKYK